MRSVACIALLAVLFGAQPHAQARPAKSARRGAVMNLSATAYCQHGETSSGEWTRRGIVAADPRVLPAGTIVRILGPVYRGIYKVADKGRLIKGRHIDIFVPTCREATHFGRRHVQVQILANAN